VTSKAIIATDAPEAEFPRSEQLLPPPELH
jgi:hypothetical protein